MHVGEHGPFLALEELPWVSAAHWLDGRIANGVKQSASYALHRGIVVREAVARKA